MLLTNHRAFIASPGDVNREREIAEQVIGRINRTIRDNLGALIDVRKWEHFAPITSNLPSEKIQDVLNREVKQCHFFILILNRRYGSEEPGSLLSNTEREIQTILRVRERDPRRTVLAYFRKLQPNDDQGSQEQRARDLRNRLEALGVTYRAYGDPEDFERDLTHDLYDVVTRIHLSPSKTHALRAFWRFGDTDRPHDPQVAVIYPPMPRCLAVDGSDPDYWLKRLTPQIAFEDFKALQKVEKSFRLLRMSSYRLFPHNNPPPEHDWLNRVWLCLPRNILGVEALRKHSERKFTLKSGQGGRPTVIEWERGGTTKVVRSPMAAYLRLQREKMATSGEWHGQLNRIITTDYAVLARLPRSPFADSDQLWDYFVAGIRGLGTWGAAWFIDREYKQLNPDDRSDDLQFLLEVQFRDGRIARVTDVSTKDQAYFDRQNDPEYIETRAAHFQNEGIVVEMD